MNRRHVVTGDTFNQANHWARRVAALMPDGDEVYGTIGFPIPEDDVVIYIVGDRLYESQLWLWFLEKLEAAGKTLFTEDSIRLMELLRSDEGDENE